MSKVSHGIAVIHDSGTDWNRTLGKDTQSVFLIELLYFKPFDNPINYSGNGKVFKFAFLYSLGATRITELFLDIGLY